jgi:hypothetical protein
MPRSFVRAIFGPDGTLRRTIIADHDHEYIHHQAYDDTEVVRDVPIEEWRRISHQGPGQWDHPIKELVEFYHQNTPVQK